eukprot:TRINITY_DN18555_c0_g1_i1.p1 TRINITY_DN18555_c0_g1~~TRINITY_DN18555_c0_g1_i1.p1  ORF type:complete len:637 (+),score=167.18 TRINITY_DN18555_c0_g1_i1:88-1998(+)
MLVRRLHGCVRQPLVTGTRAWQQRAATAATVSASNAGAEFVSRRRQRWSTDRRGWAVAVAAGSALAAASASSYQQQTRCQSLKRVRLGKLSDFEDGTMQEVQVGPEGTKTAVLVHRHAGKIYATSPACSHYGAPLKKGVSASGGKGGTPTVSCPLHDATFDLETGKVVRGPGIDGIATYAVTISGDDVWASVPAGIADGTGKHEKIGKDMVRRNNKDKRTIALVGGGPASLAAAETLRQEGFGGRIVMLTKEPHLPYDRVVLSKNLDKTAEQLRLRSQEFFDKHDIEVKKDTVVTRLDTTGQKVFFKTGDGAQEELAYDQVLVASGGTPRKLFCPGANMDGIYTLRTPEDAANITQHALPGQKMVVVGGSFIGMEIASSLRKKGCDVSVIAMESVPFERVLGKKVGASFARLLQKEGIQWFGTSQVRLFRGNETVNGVELEDGEVMAADAVVVGAGVLPNTRFVEGVSLDKNGAIVVGPLLASEACPTLFAAGDVCSFPSMRTGTHARIEHWDVATQQGRVAARNMLGKFEPFTTVPFFWSQILGKNLRFVGHAPDMLDRVIIEGDASGMEFISYYTEDDRIMAVATVNKDPVAVACAELMRRGQMPRVSELILGTVNADVILERLKKLSAPALAK